MLLFLLFPFIVHNKNTATLTTKYMNCGLGGKIPLHH